jgi:excisionase family DNA binding protein
MSSHSETSTPGLLDVDQIAELLCVKPNGIRQMVARRQIPHVRIGRRVRFDPTEIHQWIQTQRVPAS